MTGLTNTTRFTGLAEAYQKFRPGYPVEATATIVDYWAATPGLPRALADIGGGTGKSINAMQQATGGQDAGWTATVVEPNDDMRRQAEVAVAGLGGVAALKGEAEKLPFADGTMGIVLAAQAAHWFDRPRFYAEVRRVLAPGGVMCILYNNRELYDDPLTAAFESLVEETIKEYQRNYRSWDLMSELRALDWAESIKESLHPWTWRLTPEDYAGLMLSRSKMIPFVDYLGFDAARDAIIELAQGHAAADGLAGVRYITQVALARRAI